MSRYRRRSAGEMISTACFAGVGVWLLGAAMQAPPLKAALLLICSAACISGALRFVIARLFEHFRR